MIKTNLLPRILNKITGFFIEKKSISIPVYKEIDSDLVIIGEKDTGPLDIFYIHHTTIEIIVSSITKLLQDLEEGLAVPYTDVEKDFIEDYLMDILKEKILNNLDERLSGFRILPYDSETYLCVRRAEIPLIEPIYYWHYKFTHMIKVVRIFPKKAFIKKITRGTLRLPRVITEVSLPFLEIINVLKKTKTDFINKYQVAALEQMNFKKQNEIFSKDNRGRLIKKIQEALLHIGNEKVTQKKIAKIIKIPETTFNTQLADNHIKCKNGVFIDKKTGENLFK